MRQEESPSSDPYEFAGLGTALLEKHLALWKLSPGEAVPGTEWPCISMDTRLLPSLPAAQMLRPLTCPVRFCF